MSSSSLVTGAAPLCCIGSSQPGHRTTGKVSEASLPILPPGIKGSTSYQLLCGVFQHPCHRKVRGRYLGRENDSCRPPPATERSWFAGPHQTGTALHAQSRTISSGIKQQPTGAERHCVAQKIGPLALV